MFNFLPKCKLCMMFYGITLMIVFAKFGDELLFFCNYYSRPAALSILDTVPPRIVTLAVVTEAVVDQDLPPTLAAQELQHWGL